MNVIDNYRFIPKTGGEIVIIDKEKYNTTTGFEPMTLYCFNNSLKEKLCNHYKSKPDCRNLTIEEQRKYFEEHQEEFKERIRKYNSGQIDVGDFI